MFTGLIESVGCVQSVNQTDAGSSITVEVLEPAFLADAKLGDSIAIDGVCTTAVQIDRTQQLSSFTIEASPETLSKTTFGYFKPGRRVNLERPLLPSSRLGGHFVMGHVDGTASVLAKYEEGNSWIYKFLLNDASLMPYFIPKGSVSVNGISLTVNTIDKQTFSVAIIPHTLTHTNLGDFFPSANDGLDVVNIECDMVGKYIHQMVSASLSQVLPGRTSIDGAGPTGDISAFANQGKLYAGLWFNHDADIHGEYPGSDPREVMHWPGKPL